jgi:hypothetical protein
MLWTVVYVAAARIKQTTYLKLLIHFHSQTLELNNVQLTLYDNLYIFLKSEIKMKAFILAFIFKLRPLEHL